MSVAAGANARVKLWLTRTASPNENRLFILPPPQDGNAAVQPRCRVRMSGSPAVYASAHGGL